MCKAVTHMGSMHTGSTRRAARRVMTVGRGRVWSWRKLTRWHDLSAVEIIKFKETRDPGFQSGLILTSRKNCPGGRIRPQIYALTMQADNVSPVLVG